MKFERIKELREDTDTKQDIIANLLNIKQTTYSKYELGKINIPIDALIKIADFYNTSIDYIVGRTEIKEPYAFKAKHFSK